MGREEQAEESAGVANKTAALVSLCCSFQLDVHKGDIMYTFVVNQHHSCSCSSV